MFSLLEPSEWHYSKVKLTGNDDKVFHFFRSFVIGNVSEKLFATPDFTTFFISTHFH